MKRREFIALIMSATACLPITARAQQRIGILMGNASTDPEAQAWVAALVDRLRELG
jgi:hypothetical protein